MPTILVTIDPTESDDDVVAVHEELTTLGSWWHNITGTWLVDTQHPASAVRDRLAPRVSPGRRVLVIEVTAHWAGLGLSDEAEEWLDAHA